MVLEKTRQFTGILGQHFQKSPKASHLVVGDRGELEAMHYLMRQKYLVVARQWRSGKAPGDLDLIVRGADPGEALLCFVEVKTRSTRDATPAHVAVDQHKRQTLRRLARLYLTKLAREDKPVVRFDIISVYLDGENGPEIEHYQNAFGWKERSPYTDPWE
jgi:putative endonuclease